MAVTKRTRFEVLKRDQFRCYYCGTRGNETGEGLTIDHVTPVALGGSDQPNNLVSACRDCNSGKSSVTPDAETVEDVDRIVADYNHARALAMRALEADIAAENDYAAEVWESVERIFPKYAHDRVLDVESFAADWYRRGVPLLIVRKAMAIAWDGPATIPQKMRYAGGVVQHLLAGAEDRTRALVAGEEVLYNAGYEAGWHDGQIFAETQQRVGVELKGAGDAS